MKKPSAFLLFLFTLSGCAQNTIRPEPDQKMIDYGTAPTNYKEQINGYWQSTLKDPGSIQIKEIVAPEKAMAYAAEEHPRSYDMYSDVTFIPTYGYRVCATINAKNSYGGYTGWSTQTFFFSKGQFARVLYVPENFMTSFHKKGTFSAETRLTTSPCPGEI